MRMLFISCVIMLLVPRASFAEPIKQELFGRHYYLFQSGYLCRNMLGQQITTYRDHIFFHKGSICFAGDGCNDTVNCMDLLPEGVEISADFMSLKYQDQAYQYYKEPPKTEN